MHTCTLCNVYLQNPLQSCTAVNDVLWEASIGVNDLVWSVPDTVGDQQVEQVLSLERTE